MFYLGADLPPKMCSQRQRHPLEFAKPTTSAGTECLARQFCGTQAEWSAFEKMSGNPSEIGLKSSYKLSLGTYSYDLKTGMLIDPTDKIAELRNQSSKVLARLATTPGEVVTKDDLIAAAWTTPTASDDSLSQCVRDIRMALGDSGHRILKTIVGRGYCLVPSETERSVGLPPQVFLENFSFSEDSQTASNLARELYEMLEISLSQRTGIRLVTRRSELEKKSYIISGQARVHNDQVKVFISLSEGSGSGSFFAEHFNADIRDIGPLSDRIVSKISNMQRLQIYTMDGRKYAEQSNSTLTTQELMAKAAYCFAPLTEEGSKEAHLAIQAAVDRSPDNPVALCMLASVTTQMMPLVPEQSSEAVKQWAFSLADRAIAVGPRSEFAFRTRGNLRLWLRHDHAASMDDCKRSLELDPDFHLTHLTIATSDLLTGNPAKGAERLTFIKAQFTNRMRSWHVLFQIRGVGRLWITSSFRIGYLG